MNMKWETSPNGYNLEFSGSIDIGDLAELRLDSLDRAVVFSPVEKASDMLQTLEILFRRSEQMARDASDE